MTLLVCYNQLILIINTGSSHEIKIMRRIGSSRVLDLLVLINEIFQIVFLPINITQSQFEY